MRFSDVLYALRTITIFMNQFLQEFDFQYFDYVCFLLLFLIIFILSINFDD